MTQDHLGDLFARIDRALTAAIDPAGTAEHLVVTETATGRIVYPPVVPVAEAAAMAARWLGYDPAEFGITEPKPRRRWWHRRRT